MKLAIAGCGRIASVHYEAIEQLIADKNYDISISALIDISEINAKHFQQKHQIVSGIFTDFEDALNQVEFDLILICAPHDFHETLAIRSFENGKHVLLEKPMAHDLNSAFKILQSSKSSGKVFMIAENSQYWPEIVTARNLIQEGTIGDVLTARAGFVMEFDDYWFKEKKPWRYDQKRTGGGVIIDGGSHWLRPLRMWMGEIDEVVAALDYPLERMEGESLARALIRFQSGKVAAFDAMTLDTVLGPDPWWRIIGTQGEIILDSGFGGLGGVRLFDAEHRDGLQVQEAQGYAKSFGPELLDFSRAVLEGKELEAGPEHALGELRTALAMYRSVETRKWEKVWH